MIVAAVALIVTGRGRTQPAAKPIGPEPEPPPPSTARTPGPPAAAPRNARPRLSARRALREHRPGDLPRPGHRRHHRVHAQRARERGRVADVQPAIVRSAPAPRVGPPDPARRVSRVPGRVVAGPRRAHLVRRDDRPPVRLERERRAAPACHEPNARSSPSRSARNQRGGVPTATISREPPSHAIRAASASIAPSVWRSTRRQRVVDPRPPGARQADRARAALAHDPDDRGDAPDPAHQPLERVAALPREHERDQPGRARRRLDDEPARGVARAVAACRPRRGRGGGAPAPPASSRATSRRPRRGTRR